jgi:hypothetical protein
MRKTSDVAYLLEADTVGLGLGWRRTMVVVELYVISAHSNGEK